MGYIIENSVTLEALRKQLKMLQSRVKVLYGAKLKTLTLPDLTRDMVCFFANVTGLIDVHLILFLV